MATATMTRPPGEIGSRGHGPQRRITLPEYGVGRLRACMRVTADVGLDALCNQAAEELENRRAGWEPEGRSLHEGEPPPKPGKQERPYAPPPSRNIKGST